MTYRRPAPQPDDPKSVSVRDAIADVTAPLAVTDALSKLARRFGTERVLAAVKEWVAYIEKVKDTATMGADESGPRAAQTAGDRGHHRISGGSDG